MSRQRPKILFLHRNTLGQFEFFGAWLAQQGWDVTFALGGDWPDRDEGDFAIRFFPLREASVGSDDVRHAAEFAAQNAMSSTEWMMRMRDGQGYQPDIVVAHVGWGIGLCAKQVWPRCRYVAYHEWYYTDQNWAKDGKVERPSHAAGLVGNRMRNMAITTEFDSADENWCPTQFQANRFPPPLRSMIDVVPDGVDCATYAPDPSARITVDGISIPDDAPLLTYMTRGMEPLRGFPQFMRALSMIQDRRKNLHALVVANDKVAYGSQLPEGQSWHQLMLDKYTYDEDRLTVRPMMPRADYASILRASDAHVYFTEPFVTSWSLVEAMASGCLIIGSLTAPVQEMVEDMKTGILVDMDDPEEIADMVDWVLDNPKEVAAIRTRARDHICTNYDAEVLFPQKEARLRALIGA